MDAQWRLGEEPPHFQDEEIIDPNMGDSDSSENGDGETSQTFNNEIDYKSQCKYLKKKLKFLIYVSGLLNCINISYNILLCRRMSSSKNRCKRISGNF